MAAYRHQITCRLTDKNRDQLRDLTLGNRVWATFISGMEWKGKRKEKKGWRGMPHLCRGGIKGPDPPVSWSLLVGALGVRRRRQISDD